MHVGLQLFYCFLLLLFRLIVQLPVSFRSRVSFLDVEQKRKMHIL